MQNLSLKKAKAIFKWLRKNLLLFQLFFSALLVFWVTNFVSEEFAATFSLDKFPFQPISVGLCIFAANVLLDSIRLKLILEIFGLPVAIRSIFHLNLRSLSLMPSTPGGIGSDISKFAEMSALLLDQDKSEKLIAYSIVLSRAFGLLSLILIASIVFLPMWIYVTIIVSLFGLALAVGKTLREGTKVARVYLISLIIHGLSCAFLKLLLFHLSLEIFLADLKFLPAILIGQILPITLAGFGTRELFSLYLLGDIYVPQVIISASLFFGFTFLLFCLCGGLFGIVQRYLQRKNI